ncbi:Bromodomain adjacent to zinc finger domain protein 1A [Papilio xuthus]|uniref:Bromodomain adjacent to zinc finger domain protein 1A n=1 Tax=Papilio xuthus TaxID=66420 RepID=A0A194PHB9_PAPXU|nr:Bromodomain adjacent to zinc finger domain protein 1A [Papilio xuthus]
MPLLKRKAFEKSTVSEYLRDDDEVFHCEITDEIFKDYEEYCERIILVNSMVWTCEMTGKNNLTYAEAMDSEKAARKSLKDFPMELRIPILYLAAKTKRCSFAEMSEDVFNFVRERYFVGESVEACLEGDQWREAHILSVTVQKQHPNSTSTPPASSYCYEVEQFQELEQTSAGQMGTAPYDRVRRRKGVYSRDKNRLFLKQFVEQGSGGIITIKQSAMEKYNINKVNFNQIFTGSPPEFASSKKLLKTSMSPPKAKPGSATKLNKSLKKVSPDKKGRQESMDKFVKKTDKSEASPKPKQPMDPEARKNAQELVEKMRRAEDQLRQRKEEEKAKKKAHLKEWQRIKDDQELEDHKVIPQATPVQVEGIPHKHFGDFLSILEFVHMYNDILKVKDVFHQDFDLELFRKSLTLKEHAGAFSDLVQMFLTTIFTLQEDEAEEYNENGRMQESTGDAELETDIGVSKAIELATKASKWSQTYLGTPLGKLPLDPTTVTEVLRLYMLSSGGVSGGRNAAFRSVQRGGYTGADDAALRLRITKPAVVRRLASVHVADLPLEDKFLILQCLMNQVLSYATVRDITEERLEEYKITKQSLRMLQINERKREVQLVATRQELKKEAQATKTEQKLSGDQAKVIDEQLKISIEKLNKKSEVKKHEYEKKLKELQLSLFKYTSYVGMDRAYRRYWVMRRVGGLFVEAGDEERGLCRHKLSSPHLMREERAGSDKENESAANLRGSPKKPYVNGVGVKVGGAEGGAPANAHALQRARELMLCTSDINTCYVHGKVDRPHWSVYHTEEQIGALLAALNKRGLRENELRHGLEQDGAHLLTHVASCPLHLLNPTVAPPPAQPSQHMTRRRWQPSLSVPADTSLSEALELSLRDHILELEEKIFHGCLGALKVKDREAWRGTLMLKGYDKQAEYLTWGPGQKYRDDYHQPNGVLKLPNDVDKEEMEAIPINRYRDPGHYLDAPRVNGVKNGHEETREPSAEVVRGLACALLQVSQAIHHKYLKRPLGLDDKERKDREAKNKPLDLEALERWEVSLMECRSFAQVVLHLLTLDSSITWSASILNASCRICRRKTDPDNMLLCDGCNKGHHLYCLKPKLSKVPDGDWFCDQCRPREKTPRRKRKLFSDDDLEDDLDDSVGVAEGEVGELGEVGGARLEWGSVCGACGSGGRLGATCRACGARCHAECVSQRRALCNTCSSNGSRREHTVRRCAATAINNIHEYARVLDAPVDTSDSEDSEYNTALVKLKKRNSRSSKDESPVPNGAKRGRKPKNLLNGTPGRKSKSLTNGHHEETVVRKRSSRREPSVSLHTDKLETLLHDAMKHKDAWPFLDPVSTEDVPDYLDVINEPMDLTLVREKLSEGQYAADADLLADVALVFYNCFTYNKDTHPVAKAGYRLEKYLIKRCTELDLPPLPPTVLDEEVEEPVKRKYQDEIDEDSKTKRAKLK